MNLRRLAVTGVAGVALTLGLSACDFTATTNGSVTDTSTATSTETPGSVGVTAPDTATDEPTATDTATATETAEPTETTTAPATTTAPPVVVGIPQPGDADFVELDCADFPLEQADGTLLSAQDVFNSNRLDIHGLDADGDGTACEDTDPAANQNDNVADSPDESNDDAADVAVSPDAASVGITVNVQSY